MEYEQGQDVDPRATPYSYICLLNEEFIERFCCVVQENGALSSSCYKVLPTPTCKMLLFSPHVFSGLVQAISGSLNVIPN